jgi:hypothetical protein
MMGFFGEFFFRFERIKAVLIPVMTMIGHNHAQTMTQKRRLSKKEWGSELFSFWGPSLNKCRFE